jgi:3-methyl-2-oxobutanoate hydroxymethyltransferase
MVRAGIPVVGHIGLLPQRVQALGGYKVTGKNDDSERELLEDAQKIANAGACAVVLECVTSEVAQKITQSVAIPTIGIGSGTGCSGQVQVITDLLGLGGDFIPKHAKRYVDVASIITQALKTFASEVKEGTFPTEANTFHK